MAFLAETNVWEAGIYQLEMSDPVEGGAAGKDNVAPRQLANRTVYLKALVDALGTSKQPLDGTLTALAALATAADKLIYATGADTFSTATLTAFARALLDDDNAATARATLGAAPLASPGFTGTPTASTPLASDNSTALATTAFVKAAVASLVNASPATLDTLNELAVALGNDPNFATTITTALGGKQPLDGTLTALAALATSADKLIYATGPDTFSIATLTAFARTLLDDANEAEARATLGINTSYLLIRDEKAQGTAGGSSVATAMPTAQTRALNTVVANTIVGATLASNQITLPAGTYRINGSAPGYASEHRAYLYNVTDASVLSLGTSERGRVQSSTYATCTRSLISTRFTLASPKVIELRHYTSEAGATTGLGFPVTQGGNEIYSSLEIIKE